MEGVLVSARRNGSTITTTVVTNAQGVYSFPRARLEPGQYNVSIRAVGYVLDAAASQSPCDVTAGSCGTVEPEPARLESPGAALQLTDPEWFSSFPLPDQAKFESARLQPLPHPATGAMSTYNKDQLAWVMKRMVYSAGSSPMTFQLPPDQTATWGRAEWGEPSAASQTPGRSRRRNQPERGHVEVRAEEIPAAQR